MSDEWGDPVEQAKPNRWKPTQTGDALIGIVQEVKKGTYGFEAKIKQDDGIEIYTPGHAYLRSLVEKLQIGQRVQIKVTGAKKGKSGTGLLYEVRVSKQQPLTTPHATAQDAQEADRKVGVIKIMDDLRNGSRFFPEGIIPEINIKQAIQKAGYVGTATDEMFQRIKTEGLLTYAGNGLKVVEAKA